MESERILWKSTERERQEKIEKRDAGNIKKRMKPRETERRLEGRGGRGLARRSPVMRHGRYGNAAPCHTHTGIAARPSIEQLATSLRQRAGERAVRLSHIERRGERPHALHTCAPGDAKETEMPGWSLAGWFACSLTCFLACLWLSHARASPTSTPVSKLAKYFSLGDSFAVEKIGICFSLFPYPSSLLTYLV